MLSKQKTNLCPFNKFKPCNTGCALFRRGVRYKELTGEADPIEVCAINVIADNAEAMHNRSYMMQKEVGQVKDAVIMSALVDMQVMKKEHATNEILKIANPDIIDNNEPKKLLE